MSEKFNRITPEILAELREAVGAGNVVAGDADTLESYASDDAGIMFTSMPEAIVKAETTEHVSAVMRIATRHLVPVTPGGQRLAGAAVPLYGGIVLSMERMNEYWRSTRSTVSRWSSPAWSPTTCKAAAARGFL